ncbi:hypothetical protein BC831DRAFT_482677 [Entophlyctis helioformis]|nr:hypothetical protein BC831DRAFT_482677 [Entophlyctis helioformis]
MGSHVIAIPEDAGDSAIDDTHNANSRRSSLAAALPHLAQHSNLTLMNHQHQHQQLHVANQPDHGLDNSNSTGSEAKRQKLSSMHGADSQSSNMQYVLQWQRDQQQQQYTHPLPPPQQHQQHQQQQHQQLQRSQPTILELNPNHSDRMLDSDSLEPAPSGVSSTTPALPAPHVSSSRRQLPRAHTHPEGLLRQHHKLALQQQEAQQQDLSQQPDHQAQHSMRRASRGPQKMTSMPNLSKLNPSMMQLGGSHGSHAGSGSGPSLMPINTHLPHYSHQHTTLPSLSTLSSSGLFLTRPLPSPSDVGPVHAPAHVSAGTAPTQPRQAPSDPNSLKSCPRLQQVLSTKNEVSDRVKANRELAFVIDSSPQMVQFFQLIQMDRIMERLKYLDEKISSVERLEQTLERLVASQTGSVQIPNACMLELRHIATLRMNAVNATPYHCDNENKEILRFIKQSPTRYAALHAFIKGNTVHEDKIGARFSELITNCKSTRKKMLVPKATSHLFMSSMLHLNDWTSVMFDNRVSDPPLEQRARAAFLRYYRDHGHLLVPQFMDHAGQTNGAGSAGAPLRTIDCTCPNAYEHLTYLDNYIVTRSANSHGLIVAAFSKKGWLLSGFWREFDKAVEEVYQQSNRDALIERVIEVDLAKYTHRSSRTLTGETSEAGSTVAGDLMTTRLMSSHKAGIADEAFDTDVSASHPHDAVDPDDDWLHNPHHASVHGGPAPVPSPQFPQQGQQLPTAPRARGLRKKDSFDVEE